MDGKYINYLNDCYDEMKKIKTWIDSNKIHSNVRFLVSYSVIKACGTIEFVLKQMIFDLLIAGGANEEAKNHFSKHILEASFNPSCGQIIQILSTINPTAKQAFETVIHGTTKKGDLTSLIELRNSFAHGNSIAASIDDVIKYYDSGNWVLERLYIVLFTR
jgi:hypothetical protein